MDKKYQVTTESLTFYKGEEDLNVRVEFRGAPTYEGPANGLSKHLKGVTKRYPRGCGITNAAASGQRVRLFYTYTPTTRRERDFIAGKINAPVQKGQSFTFATRFALMSLYKDLNHCGIPTKDSSFDLGHIEVTEAAPAAEELPV